MYIMKKILNTIFFILPTLFAILSCGEDRSHEYYELTKENQWIFSTMKEAYLWSDNMKTPERSQFFSQPEKFFNSLLHRADKASYFTDSIKAGDYGMSFQLMRDPIAVHPSKVYALVLFVEPGSSAYNAGIRRGTWLSAINGKSLLMSSQAVLQSGEGAEFKSEYIDFDDSANKYIWAESDTFVVESATSYTCDDIYFDTIYSLRDKKAGYIFCNSFNSENFKAECDEAFSRFAAEEVSDIIIDLRYNSGGTVSNAAYMASSLVPASLINTPFCILMKGNDEIDTVYNFVEPSFNFGEKRVYFLTGTATKGTAELLAASVNSLREKYNVTIVGESTEGSNLVVKEFKSVFGFSIAPAVSMAYLPTGETIETGGIVPDYTINEVEEIENIHPIGHEQEYLLYNVFYHMINGTMPESLGTLSQSNRVYFPQRESIIR